MTKTELEQYVTKKYGTLPEYPFARYPDVAIFRHKENKKWYAAIMTVEKTKLGLSDPGAVSIINLKIAEEIRDSFIVQDSIFPGYHMNKRHWVSVLLDGSVDADTLIFLLDVSYDLTR